LPFSTILRAFEPPAVDEVHVEPAVAVVVEERGPAARGVEQVVLVGAAGQEHARDPGLGRDVDETEARLLGRVQPAGTRPHGGEREPEEGCEDARASTQATWPAS
jgi:hypothetical protein